MTGTGNTAVTWNATGGSITTTGLYTAGGATGSFTVTATSVQDAAKSASAAVTVTPPQAVSVSVAPASTTVFTGGTQQFTATVANATNTAVTWNATGGTITRRVSTRRDVDRAVHGDRDQRAGSGARAERRRWP